MYKLDLEKSDKLKYSRDKIYMRKDTAYIRESTQDLVNASNYNLE